MRLFPATKTAILLCCAVLAFGVPSARAQNMPLGSSGATPAAPTLPGGQQMTQQQAQAYARQLSRMMQQNAAATSAQAAPAAAPAKPAMTQSELSMQLKDPDSPQYKANELAEQAKQDRSLDNFGRALEIPQPNPLDSEPVPPSLAHLQDINKNAGQNISDDLVTKKLATDMRRDSQRMAALSYGARGGLAKRSFEVLEELKGFEPTLDKVFNFRALLVKAPSGLLIEPPIIRESLNATVVADNGNEAAVADQILQINKQAKIVTAPRDWRQYLEMTYDTVITPPPKILWPKNEKEQASWNQWVKEGWSAGYEQGEQIFEANVAQMVTDYSGMVRYRTLLAEGKISQPYALQEDRGVTGGRTEMRVGDRALRITGPSQFLTGADLWKPADR
jgi:defect in organelle trafficking protein DotC